MWRIELDNGFIVTENSVQYWDNLGKDIKIKEITFRVFGNKVIFKDARKYCVAKIGNMAIASQQRQVGYCIYSVFKDHVEEVSLKYNGVSKREYPISELQVPDRCLRNGIETLPE